MLSAMTALADVSVRVTGLGWLKDRELRVSLRQLLNLGASKSLDSNSIEDAAVVVNAALDDEGFHRAVIEISATLADGSVKRFAFDPTFTHPVPRPLSARALAFGIRKGVRWRITDVRIDGLRAISRKAGTAFFRNDSTLFVLAATNAYSASRLKRSEGALLDELRRRGYADATVRAEVAHVNERTGAVAVHVTANQGARWRVARIEITGGEAVEIRMPSMSPWTGKDWNTTLEQDIREAVRLAFYHAGYPDVAIHDRVEASPPQGGVRDATIFLNARPGERVTIGRVRFEGSKVTRTSVLRSRVRVRPGEPLDPVELERARYRISRLGVFQSVDLGYDPPTGPTRNPVFTLKEGPRYETDLLFGYGSYEQFRGGVELSQMNVFGLAHQTRLQLVQSVKSTRGEYSYTVPELFGETVDGTAKLFGLQRREIAFERQEYGGTVSLRRAVDALHGAAAIGYTFEALRNRKNGLSTEPVDEKQVNVASIDLQLTTSRLDNALRPHRGYHGSLQLQVASPNFGGATSYQRLEMSGAYHTPWGSGRWIHLGLSHGVITTLGAQNDLHLPVNERFYPGGDNSIRGYRAGEAAPRGPDGKFIGAKSYLLANLELEQALTPSWSIVAFTDALGTASKLKHYPFDQRLYSAGLGLRYETIVGPIRAEYGRNLNPRPGDPRGTLLISIGYPF